MKLFTFFKCLAIGLLCFAVCGCTDIDNLSDSNDVTSFVITSYEPASIDIGDAEIDADASVIYIPVKYGEHNFPLTFTAKVGYSGKIHKLLGVDFSKELTLDSVESEIKFVVMAESGLPHEYAIKVQMLDYVLPEYMDFETNTLSPAESLIFNTAVVSGQEMTFFFVDPVYPVSLTPDFDLSGLDVEFEGFTNGETELTFADEDSEVTFNVIDTNNNTKKPITVRTKALTLVSGTDNESTGIYNTEFGVAKTSGDDFTYEGFRIYGDTDNIELYVSTGTSSPRFPLSFDVTLKDFEPGMGTIGFTGEVSFDALDIPESFYMVDLSQAVARKWSLSAIKYEDPLYYDDSLDVLGFSYEYTASSNIVVTGGSIAGPSAIMNTSYVHIDAENANIEIGATTINVFVLEYFWSLTLKNMSVELAPNSSHNIPSTIVWNRSNTAWETPKTFTVTAASGATKQWSISIRNLADDPLSSEAEITNASVKAIKPLQAYANNVFLDPSSKTITIQLGEDEDSYPLQVWLDYTTTDNGSITSQNGGTDPLVFDTSLSTQTVTVTSEDGTVTENYTVKLISPEDSVEPNITTFSVSSLSSTWFSVDQIDIDTDNAEVVINFAKTGSCPLTVGYKLALPRRTTADIDLEGTMSFDNLNDTNTFTVTSSAGQSKLWTVRIAPFAPQLINQTFDVWTDSNTLYPAGTSSYPYWASANNSFVKGTSQVANGSGYAVNLSTGSALNRLTSASVFLGYFYFSTVNQALNDPVSATYQGIEFSASKKIIGLEIDVNYTMSDKGTDSGSVVMELIRHDPSKGAYVYHGNAPDSSTGTSSPHADNTAVSVARARYVMSNTEVGYIENDPVTVVQAGQWHRVRLTLDYKVSDVFDYTHLSVICASSAEGDSFKGYSGSVLKLDNVTIIYED